MRRCELFFLLLSPSFMNKLSLPPSKSLWAAAAALLLVILVDSRPLAAREKWPRTTAEAKAHADEVKAHEDEVLRQIAPELEAWAKQGKPFIPHAVLPSDLPQAPVLAFPEAEGAGAHSFGGRGGRIWVITTLADRGPGSLREAVESAGPRVVVFNVAGIIHLEMPLFIKAPYLTIAGQTAPGDGICVAGATTLVDTHDVVIRYMRFRRGETNVFDRDDALGGNPIGNIIVDHCSTSWGFDENLSMYRHMYHAADQPVDEKLPTLNITIQWCISSEAFNNYNHAFGGTWGGRNTSFHHNLFASNTGRNPSIGMSYDFNFTNNVLYNWVHRTMDGGDKGSLINCIANYYKPGPATPDNPVRYRLVAPAASQSKAHPEPIYGKIYATGNFVEGNPAVTADNWAGGIQFRVGEIGESEKSADATVIAPLIKEVRSLTPFPMAPVALQTAQAAYVSVLGNAGATLPKRDPVDLRILQMVRTGTVTYAEGKGIVTDPNQVGGYPKYQGKPFADLGADGIPRTWKTRYGLDPADTNLANRDLQGDGYTVMDKYLDGLDPTKKFAGSGSTTTSAASPAKL
jgi:hypothetical protein